jgi:Tfp pilus assembly protein PilF
MRFATAFRPSASAALVLFALAAACGNPKAQATKRLQRADQALQQDQLDQAAAEYEAVLKHDRLNERAYLGLARVRIRQRRPDQAEWALTRALDALRDWPRIRECYVALSDIYIRDHHQPAYLNAADRMASLLLQRCELL